MAQGEEKTPIDQQAKDKMLDDLESLSRMLDEEDDNDHPATIPEDIPVLKSFVDDVPVLSEAFEESPKDPAPSQIEQTATNPKTAPSERIDHDANSTEGTVANANTGVMTPVPVGKGSSLDMSFLDKDPLDISDRVRDYRSQGGAGNIPADDPSLALTQVVMQQAAASSTSKPAPSAPTTPAAEAGNPQSSPRPAPRFQEHDQSENPFLPRSTLEKIRKNHTWNQNQDRAEDASSQLRKLLQDNPLNKINFDPNSREAQLLRQKASQMVDEVIRTNMHRLEAELRMKLEQEVDRMFKDAKKNPR